MSSASCPWSTGKVSTAVLVLSPGQPPGAAEGEAPVHSGLSVVPGFQVGLVYMFNLIVGTGALTMPKAFATAGWLVSLVLLVFLGFMR